MPDVVQWTQHVVREANQVVLAQFTGAQRVLVEGIPDHWREQLDGTTGGC